MFFCGILCLQFTLMFFKSGSENVLRKFSIAFTSIMFSSHALAVERLRWGERYRAPVPREWRLCRFCRAHVEDEAHALIECRGDSLHDLHPVREAMRSDIIAVVPDFTWGSDAHTVLLHLLHDIRVSVPVARFIYKVLSIFYSVPMYVPPPYLYSPLITHA